MTGPTHMAAELALDPASREGASERVGDAARRQAFATLAREHLESLYGLARRLGPTADEAEDVVQEVLLKAWRHLGRFRREADLRTWLYRILLNTCHDHYRTSSRRSRLRLPEGNARKARPAPDPVHKAQQKETVDRVLEGVGCLPRRQRECLLLRARVGLTYREIASLLRIREGVVRQHLVCARKKLVARFGEEVREWGRETR